MATTVKATDAELSALGAIRDAAAAWKAKMDTAPMLACLPASELEQAMWDAYAALRDDHDVAGLVYLAVAACRYSDAYGRVTAWHSREETALHEAVAAVRAAAVPFPPRAIIRPDGP